MFPAPEKISRYCFSATPAVVSKISFTFVMIMIGKGWLW